VFCSGYNVFRAFKAAGRQEFLRPLDGCGIVFGNLPGTLNQGGVIDLQGSIGLVAYGGFAGFGLLAGGFLQNISNLIGIYFWYHCDIVLSKFLFLSFSRTFLQKLYDFSADFQIFSKVTHVL